MCTFVSVGVRQVIHRPVGVKVFLAVYSCCYCIEQIHSKAPTPDKATQNITPAILDVAILPPIGLQNK